MNILDEFGERLMVHVRDEAISNWQMILNGTMKGERADFIRSQIDSSNTDLSLLIPEVVDSVLHWLLVWAESDPNFVLCWKRNGTLEDLEENSDGLAGELYGRNGWIAKYSRPQE